MRRSRQGDDIADGTRPRPPQSAVRMAIYGTAIVTTTPRNPVNPWLIAMTVMLATFMEVLDTTIANVALPHIAGNLSAASTRAPGC